MSNSTTQYNQFKSLNYNRELDERHVKKLVASIKKKNLLHLNPIIVDTEMNVIDGQHRLEAATRLKLPIYYEVEYLQGDEMQLLNSASKNWNAMDYLNYWTVRKAPGYAELSKFVNQYPQIPLTGAKKMVSASGENKSANFQNGKIDIRNIEKAYEIAEQLKEYRNRYNFTYSSKFVDAVIELNKVEGYSHERMMRKIEMQPRAVQPCANLRQYLDMFEEVYNYKEQTRLRFR